MSWDVCLRIDTGYHTREVTESRNYTSNVWEMFDKAGLENGIKGLDGMSAKNAALVLDPVIRYMETHPDEMQQFNAQNGWGDYEGALEFVKGIFFDCLENPKCTVYVWY
jgi:hypothetical protein